MRPSVAAAVAAGLWVLCTVGAAAPRRCLLSHYRSLEPRTLSAAKALRDRYVSDRPGPASPGPWPRRVPTRPSLSRGSCAWLRHVARGIADAQAVLSRLHRPELLPGAGPILELLAAAAACLELARPGSSRKVPGAPRRPSRVVFNLLRLLTWELRLAAHSGPCL
uniref:Interferon lambda 4 (gene/pseudogene) n=1 Tax=Cebus imitator TaxID=2715852 RepID=A0A2K5PMI8_CEBIM